MRELQDSLVSCSKQHSMTASCGWPAPPVGVASGGEQ